jgi:hypothetical protein
MPRIRYEHINFKPETLQVIEQANAIIETYAAQGFDLTLRQLYYQFVSRDLIPNRQKEYDRLGDILSKARRAGLVDWDAIVDRTRNLRSPSVWSSPEQIVQAVAAQFRYDPWLTQDTYVEVWYEKEALAGVFGRIAGRWRVSHFACKGYPSDSEVWRAARRFATLGRQRHVLVLHFGDHDPSGIDMTRDIEDRFTLFGAPRVEVRRLALNMDQVDKYEPPPNPAKTTDSRYSDYSANFGEESWELDALEPTVLADLVTQEVRGILDEAAWEEEMRRERVTRAELAVIAEHYPDTVKKLARYVDERVKQDEELAVSDLDDEPEMDEE